MLSSLQRLQIPLQLLRLPIRAAPASTPALSPLRSSHAASCSVRCCAVSTLHSLFLDASPAPHSRSAARSQTPFTTPLCCLPWLQLPSQILLFQSSGISLSRAFSPIGCRPSMCHPTLRSVLSTNLPVRAGLFCQPTSRFAPVLGLFAWVSTSSSKKKTDPKTRTAQLFGPAPSVFC